MRHMRSWTGLLVTGLIVAGCSKPAPEPAPTPVPTAPPIAVVTPVPVPAGVLIRTIELGSSIGPDKRVTVASTAFKPADTIYVTVLTDGSAQSATLQARFLYGADGQLVKEETQTIAPTGPTATEFHISNPDGWPVGTYAVEVSLDGGAPTRAEFRVE
jgi:hypothetical protein